MKLWKVRVNNWGWYRPGTFYAESREEAEKIRREFPVADDVKYAGNFTEYNAKRLLDESFLDLHY